MEEASVDETSQVASDIKPKAKNKEEEKDDVATKDEKSEELALEEKDTHQEPSSEIQKAAVAIRNITKSLGKEFALNISTLNKVLDELDKCSDPGRAHWLLEQAISMVQEMHYLTHSTVSESETNVIKGVIYQSDDSQGSQVGPIDPADEAITHLINHYTSHYPVTEVYDELTRNLTLNQFE